MSSLQMAHFVRSGVSPYTEKVLVSSATNPFEGAPAAEVGDAALEAVPANDIRLCSGRADMLALDPFECGRSVTSAAECHR